MTTRTHTALAAVALALPAGAIACSEEPHPDAVRLVAVADFLHAEASLMSWLFDASSEKDGVGAPTEPVLRPQELRDFLGRERDACATTQVIGDAAQVSFDGCDGPYGLGTLNGDLSFSFGRVGLDVQRVLDFMLVESFGEVELDGHRMEIRYYADALYSELVTLHPYGFAYRTDVRGITSGGVILDLASDPETAVNPEICATGSCSSPRTGLVYFDPQSGCVEFDVSEDRSVVDGIAWGEGGDGWSVSGSYRKCPNQCPGGCSGGASPCQLHGGLASLHFDGSPTTSTVHEGEVELDCGE
jgi:hypothetical protein